MASVACRIAIPGRTINRLSPQAIGLIGYWPLNDAAGRQARDLAGNNPGWIAGGAAINRYKGGPFGGAFYGNGTDVEVQLANRPVIGNVAEFTVTMWVQYTSVATSHVFYEGSSTSDTPLIGLFTQAANTGILQCSMRDDAGNTDNSMTDTAARNDGRWHHVAFVQNSKSSRAFYVDGILRASSSSPTMGAITTDRLTIGHLRRLTPGTFWWHGQVADFRIYSRALSAKNFVEFMADPLAIYRPRRRRLFPLISGSSVSIAAIARSTAGIQPGVSYA